ncbi:PadR family transcriptional regulator [Propionispora vibrioides]|uniref:Transcriptional regulator PadR-like family protein n=1 Tax=Propionispora vibrioides TaxID=112903 RepID=A0A1H8XY98_9FIRM|nr:PadR family transcriptional regulator [Propionispora vibrioides]SEP45030.1 Transcriptional regulator PadR-like family protein [Propionispora vibrioides]
MVQKSEQKTWTKIIMALYLLTFLAKGPAYGNKMAEEIKRRTQGAITPNPNALYPLLRIMEERSYVVGHWEDNDKRSKRIYSITEQGRAYIPELVKKVTARLNEVERNIQIIRNDLL